MCGCRDFKTRPNEPEQTESEDDARDMTIDEAHEAPEETPAPVA